MTPQRRFVAVRVVLHRGYLSQLQRLAVVRRKTSTELFAEAVHNLLRFEFGEGALDLPYAPGRDDGIDEEEVAP